MRRIEDGSGRQRKRRGAVSKASESQRGGEVGSRLAMCKVEGYEAQDEGRATESVVVRGCGTRQGAALVTRGAAEMVAGRREKRRKRRRCEEKMKIRKKEEEKEEKQDRWPCWCRSKGKGSRQKSRRKKKQRKKLKKKRKRQNHCE
ncbi:hypothetical protein M440DRAFT_83529 [Trichoderma longibrachiatum ATCC 18648]|uniref:Uncharacterized protein n=1 Tax=Trichoderma longibrachiatum ATCC 18648 TaxID=983965 RepID=A0A2T4CIN4_TRILO|nr:hypothetical protein M440DRAFT_83529 [Trichoderma longibrachiatum ATCC 18648]